MVTGLSPSVCFLCFSGKYLIKISKMNNSVKKSGFKLMVTFLFLLVSQMSVFAQGAVTPATDPSLSAFKVIVFFVILLVLIIAPAFKRSEHVRHH